MNTEAVVHDTHILTIDRSKPFNPVKRIGAKWLIWKGPLTPFDGITGRERQDSRSLSLTEIDFDKVLLETTLKKDELWITGYDRLHRHLKSKKILLDAKVGETLYLEKKWATLEYLHEKYGVKWVDFPGTVLRCPDGYPHTLYLYRWENKWYMHWRRFQEGYHPVYPSLVLPVR